MSRLVWDAAGERLYETGLKMGVVYPQAADGTYPKGVAWNGLTSVSESPSGAESSPLYADDIKYVDLRSAEEFGATVEAYTYPEEFAKCDGSAFLATGVRIGQQARSAFGLCYRTVVGNDVKLDGYGYKLHLIYGATVTPSERGYQTINDSPEAITFSWEMTTVPVSVDGFKPTASLEIDSTKVDATELATLEAILYGSDSPVYVATVDSSKKEGKTYYTEDDDSYTEFAGDSFVAGTTYYEKFTDPTLPLPDMVASLFTA